MCTSCGKVYSCLECIVPDPVDNAWIIYLESVYYIKKGVYLYEAGPSSRAV